MADTTNADTDTIGASLVAATQSGSGTNFCQPSSKNPYGPEKIFLDFCVFHVHTIGMQLTNHTNLVATGFGLNFNGSKASIFMESYRVNFTESRWFCSLAMAPSSCKWKNFQNVLNLNKKKQSSKFDIN